MRLREVLREETLTETIDDAARHFDAWLGHDSPKPRRARAWIKATTDKLERLERENDNE